MKIEELKTKQNRDGGFGRFHSMSYDSDLTTEKALRRFLFLNLNKDEDIVQRSLDYLEKCLNKEIKIPDRREKVINWDVFEELMFTSWLSIFNYNTSKTSEVKNKWKRIIEKSIVNNELDPIIYKKEYRSKFGPNGTREISPSTFYMVTLLKDVLEDDKKSCYFKYIMENGIYYIYNENIYKLPSKFDSKNTINYLLAIKFLIPFKTKNDDLEFVRNWLLENKHSEYWDMPSLKPDGIVFPRSENWRNNKNKIKDINEFIIEIFKKI